MKIQKELSGNANDYFEKWAFLRKWDDIELSEKLKVIDDYFSHELNFYVYQKDREFFDDILKPHLANKIEKCLIDYYLLGSHEWIRNHYKNPSDIKGLNAIEIYCLIDVWRLTDKAKCQQILHIMEGVDKKNDYRNGNLEFSMIFDKILNTKTTDVKNAVPQQVLKERGKIARQTSECYSEASSGRSGDDDLSFEMQKSVCMMLRQDSGEVQRRRSHSGNANDSYSRSSISSVGSDRPVRRAMRSVRPQQRRAMQTRARMPLRQRSFVQQQKDYGRDDGCEDDGSEDDGRDESYPDDEDCSGQGWNDLKGRRAKVGLNVKRMFKNQDTQKNTKMMVEKGYFLDKSMNQNSEDIVQVSKFWLDAYNHLLASDGSKFLSINLVYSHRTLSERIFALAILDLPYTSINHEYNTRDDLHFFKMSNDSLILIKDLQETSAVSAGNDTLAAQRWFDQEERYIYDHETHKEIEKEVKEFLTMKVYGSQIVVTNVTSIEQSIQCIAEIPQGSIPVKTLGYFTTNQFNLKPFSTKNLEFWFYFPRVGEFTFYPASITKDGSKVSVQVNKSKLLVLKELPKKEKMETLTDILAQGSKTDIINFMKEKNISNTQIFDFKKIYWLLKDPEFYLSCLTVLKSRMIFDTKVWSYSIYHGDTSTALELFNHDLPGLLPLTYFDSLSIHIDQFTLKEFHPIFNNRFHALMSGNCNILNKDFKETYLEFLYYLFEKDGKWVSKDYLIFAYYLLLQERVDDACGWISRCEALEVESQGAEGLKEFGVQYDYLKAYFDMYNGYPGFEVARRLCDTHIGHSVVGWRNRFVDMANQLAEFDGELKELKNQAGGGGEGEATDGKPVETKKIFESKVDENGLIFDVRGVHSIKIEFFYIDLEILFSRNPFIKTSFDEFVYVQPNSVMEVPFAAETSKQQQYSVKIPDHIQ